MKNNKKFSLKIKKNINNVKNVNTKSVRFDENQNVSKIIPNRDHLYHCNLFHDLWWSPTDYKLFQFYSCIEKQSIIEQGMNPFMGEN